MGTLKTTNIQSISGSGTVTLGTSGETFTVPSGVTVNMSSATQTGVGGVNTPMFSAKATGNQTGLTSGGWTKVQFDTATFNEGSDYDTTNDKFVAPSAGKYFFTASVKVNSAGGSATLLGTGLRFTINGSTAGDNLNFIANGALSAMNATNTMIVNLTATQYVEVYAYYQDNGGGTGSITGSGDLSTQFYGCKLIT